jgi:ubiquinone/menaquinone biosynthesis C-methylase UbiE
VGARETHGLGYERVDEDPNVAVLVSAMEATARWDATRELRAWERQRLGLSEGQRLLDVGCGLGDAALALAEDLGEGDEVGEVVGVDASAEMLRVAQARARARSSAVPCRVRFCVGDAMDLDEPDRSFHAVRSERTLQWLADPPGAVAEMVRVLVPGGRLSLIDTDWSTLRIDVGDEQVTARVREALRTERRRPSNVGGRLGDLVVAAGLDRLAETRATQVWTAWDPDASPAPDGCFSMESLADDLVAAGRLDPSETERFVSTIHDEARQGRFTMSLTAFAVVATAPTPTP